MNQPRIVGPREAKQLYAEANHAYLDLAHTAAVLGKQREAVLALHPLERYTFLDGRVLDRCATCNDKAGKPELYPCPTRRALGANP